VHWQTHPDVVWIGDDDEIRLYHSARGEFETLNATAAAIWRLADAGRTLEDMVAELAATFGAGDDAQRRRIRTDVREFVDELTARGILIADAEPDPVAGSLREPVADDAPVR
jgi:Coenzyme PQQ synthesis protein D (PqqD)